MRKLLHFVLGETLDQNGWYLCLEIFWSAILATALTFNSALAIRLGATSSEVAWLSSSGTLTALVAMPLAGRFLQKRTKRKRWLLLSVFVYRLCALLLIAIPWLHLSFISAGSLLIVVMLVFTLPQHVVNVGISPFLSEAVALEARATVFSARNALGGLATVVFSVAFGALLVVMPFPANYQLMLLVGFLFGLLSTYHLSRVQVTESDSAPAPAAPTQSLRRRWDAFVAELRAAPGYVQMVVNTLGQGIGMWMATPLFTLYLLRDLHLDENWLGILAAVNGLASIVGYMVFRRLMRRWGEPKTLKLNVMLLGLYPLLTGLTGWLPLIVLAALISGLVQAGFNLSHFNTWLRVVPAEKRHDYMSLHLGIVNFGIGLAPLIGVALANRFGFGPMLVVCGLLAMAGASSFVWRPVGEAPPAPLALASDAGATGN